MGFAQDDLIFLHRDQSRFNASALTDADGSSVFGFLSEETMVDDGGDAGALVAENVLVLRSATRYPPSTRIRSGVDAYVVEKVAGIEGAWRHYLRAA